MKQILSLLLLFVLAVHPAAAGLLVVRSSGISMTGADGVEYVGPSGIALTGADGWLAYKSNGIALTGADGIALTGADGISMTGADGATYVGANGITMTGADGIAMTGADGVTLTGANGITMTGADGTTYRADSIVVRQPAGIAMTGADNVAFTGTSGIALTGLDGVTRTSWNGIAMTGADGISMTGADGIAMTGADLIAMTGADLVTGLGPNGVLWTVASPSGIAMTGADGIAMTGADGITVTGATGIALTGADAVLPAAAAADAEIGLQSLDPEFAAALDAATDDSSLNAVVVFHRAVTDADLDALRALGIFGGTRFRRLPMIYVSATKSQILAVSRLASVRSIYGNRTLTLNTDSYLKPTGIQRVAPDADLRAVNGGLALSGRSATVAVLDTGINAGHPDLAGRVAQNVRLADAQSAPAGFVYPAPVENLANTDPVSGHGTLVAGVIAGDGASSAGRYAGAAPGARLVGLSAGDLNLTQVLAGFDWLLEKGALYNVRVVNCSFSANTVFDFNDPVNIATRLLYDGGVNVVFSAGNNGPGSGSLNPYAAAPWVIGVGATDPSGRLAAYSARGSFADSLRRPDIVAPGTNLIGLRSAGTTGAGGLATGADTQRLTASELAFYTTASGTSFSAPQVAGVAALMLDANPSLTPAAVADIIGRTATPMPRYFRHEVGAGMLNAHAAVLEAAFPLRRMGFFRAAAARSGARFETSAQRFGQTVVPGTPALADAAVPPDVVEANFYIAWGFGVNDLALKIADSSGATAGESNLLNLPGFTGRFERVSLRNPASGTFQAAVRHTAGVGTAQRFDGAVEITRALLPALADGGSLSRDAAATVRKARVAGIFTPDGATLRGGAAATRQDLAEIILRAGLAPQYVASAPMFTDVRDESGRTVVESVQSTPNGRLIYDASPGGLFRRGDAATKLVLAVALVRALGLEPQAATATLPLGIADAASIPSAYRGHFAVALDRGLIALDGSFVNPTRAATRFEMIRAAVVAAGL